MGVYASCVSWVVKKGTDMMVAIVTIMHSETGITSEITDSAPYFSSFCFSCCSRASISCIRLGVNRERRGEEAEGKEVQR